MDSKTIEFKVIEMLCMSQSFKRIDEDTEIILVSPDTAEVNNLNTDDLLLAVKDINLFDVKIDIENHRMTLTIKEPYKNFDNLMYVNSSEIYKELYGSNLDNYLKLMIAFLCNIDDAKELRNYNKMLDEKVREKLKEYFSNKI